ncbi:MAG TPA: hypothetical protein VKU80_17185 [Planctomycetota bacterium]|nr:hypothetical protein [Planctomycetota bacterium]
MQTHPRRRTTRQPGRGALVGANRPKAPFFNAMTMETLLRWLELGLQRVPGFDGCGALAEIRHRLR